MYMYMRNRAVSHTVCDSSTSQLHNLRMLPHLDAMEHQWQPLLLRQATDNDHQRTPNTTCIKGQHGS